MFWRAGAAACLVALAAGLQPPSSLPPSSPPLPPPPPPPSPLAAALPAAPRILVLSYSDRVALHAVTFPLLRAYCERHGFSHRLVAAPGAFAAGVASKGAVSAGVAANGAATDAAATDGAATDSATADGAAANGAATDGVAAQGAGAAGIAADGAATDGGAPARSLGGPPRAAAWRKIELLVDAIEAAAAAGTHDVIVFFDDDIIITDPSQPLGALADRFGTFPPLIYEPPAARLLLLGEDMLETPWGLTGAVKVNPANSGLILARADARAAALLRLVWDAAPVLSARSLTLPNFEQEIFALLWPALRVSSIAAPKRALQSMLGWENDNSSWAWLPGDFAAHPAGLPDKAQRLQALAAHCGARVAGAAGVAGAASAAAQGTVGCSAPAFFGGARFSQTTALLRALVGEQLGRSVAAVGAPPAGAYVATFVAESLRPAVFFMAPLAAAAGAAPGPEAPLAAGLIDALNSRALTASRQAAAALGMALFATQDFPRPQCNLLGRVVGAPSLGAAARSAAALEEQIAERILAAGSAAAANSSASPQPPAFGGLAAVLIFAPHGGAAGDGAAAELRAEAARLAATLAEAAPLVRPASGVVCVLGTRRLGEGGDARATAGACSRPALARIEILAALARGAGAAFRVAGASLPWDVDEDAGSARDSAEDAAFFAAAREHFSASGGKGAPWVLGGAAARAAAREPWDCPCVCFARAGA